MRQTQNAKRPRTRGRKVVNHLNRAMDSSGPDVKIRGTASHIHDKYQALARDANAAGDRIMAENYLQHAEHYLRVINAVQAANAPQPGARPHTGASEQPDMADAAEDGPEDVPAQPAADVERAARPKRERPAASRPRTGQRGEAKPRGRRRPPAAEGAEEGETASTSGRSGSRSDKGEAQLAFAEADQAQAG